jgi:protocatechuate 3,4-dioxygenase beta subunit
MEQKSSSTVRRTLLTRLAGISAVLMLPKQLWAVTEFTPAQPEGPFYPDLPQQDNNWDLTKVEGMTAKANGQLIYVRGKVLDRQGNAVVNARVEIWQTDENGNYKHSRQRSRSFDKNFQGTGFVITNEAGVYLFKTIMPKAYSMGSWGYRTPHIHFKIFSEDFGEFTTQMYFAGESRNSQDPIRRRVPKQDRKFVTIDFSNQTTEYGETARVGDFNIYLA